MAINATPTPAAADLECRVKDTHATLLAADETYACERSPEANLAVARAQVPYYAALAHYWRATQTYPVYLVRRARLILRRAKQNRLRETDDPVWQDLTLHQYRRARTTLARARAQAEWGDHTPPKPPKRLRVKHPITGRFVYADTMTKE